jgi:hypothetical protein
MFWGVFLSVLAMRRDHLLVYFENWKSGMRYIWLVKNKLGNTSGVSVDNDAGVTLSISELHVIEGLDVVLYDDMI